MGDRSNIVIQESNGNRIYLYGHWMGEDSINVVRDVLAQRERWSDAPYLARMLFARMIQGSPDSSTGFGISTYMCDNEYPVIVLDPETQTIVLEDSKEWGKPLEPITPAVGFDTFIMCGAETSPTFADVAVDMGAKLVAS